MSTFYIMKAHHITSTKAKLHKIIEHEPSCTILIASREHGWNRMIPCYIIGSPSDYDVKAGSKVSHTIDTGMGHTNRDRDLLIEHVMQVRNGLVVNVDGIHVDPFVPESSTTVSRSTFVMK